MKLSFKDITTKSLLIIVGSALYAIGIALFLDPNNLAPGGVTGVSIILNYLTEISTGQLIIIINVPILAVGIWKFGLRFFLSTIISVAISSVFVDLLSPIGALTNDKLLAAAFGGSSLAVGVALLFKAGASSGGTDIIVRLIKRKFKHVKTGKLFLMIDVFIVAISAFVFQNIEVALYAGVAAVTTSFVFDLALYGADEAKLIYIVTKKDEQITQRILKEVDVGVTYLKAKGAYSNTDMQVIMCAVQKRLLPMVQEIATHEDQYAFLIVSSASEIFGQGFKDIKGERL